MRKNALLLSLTLLASAAAAQSVVSRPRAVDLDQTVTIRTPEAGTPLPLFMEDLSALTGLSQHVTAGQHTMVRADFHSQPVRTVLDQVCNTHGLNWELQGGVILIKRRLETETIRVQRHAVPAVQRLFENGMIEQIINTPGGAVPGQQILFDDTLGVVSITSDPDRISRVEELVQDLNLLEAPAVTIDTRMYNVDPAQAERLGTLVEARLRARERVPGERRVIVEGDTLIVRDTEQNLALVESMLTEEQPALQEGLDVRVYNLAPRNVADSPEQAVRFADQVVETVRTLLYATDGEAVAARDGRRLWYDPEIMQLTVTDRPANLQRVDRYVTQIPQLDSGRRIVTRIPIEGGRSATEVAQQLGNLVDVGRGGQAGPLMGALPSRGQQGRPASGGVLTRTLRQDDEVLWGDLRVTLVDVFGPPDEPDTATFVIDTPTSSVERSIPVKRSAFVDDQRIRVTEISRSGRVTIEITPVGTDPTILQ